MSDRPKLQPNDACWLLHGTLLYEVTVTEARVSLPGDKHEFTLYRLDAPHFYLREERHHREDLFLRPAEVKELRKRIEEDIHTLEGLLKYELEDVEDES